MLGKWSTGIFANLLVKQAVLVFLLGFLHILFCVLKVSYMPLT